MVKYATIAWASMFAAGGANAITFGTIAHSLKPDVEITAHPQPEVTKIAAVSPARADGSGQRAPNGASAFRALWDDESCNMPPGQGGTLSDKDAWDVAMFVVDQAKSC